jgi:heme oxygenase (biliverdin-IX-beta and delta-forming)
MRLAEATEIAPTPEGVATRLKASTALIHRRLEADIDIIDAIGSAERLRRLIERFWGFHRVWEPAAAALIDDEAFFGPRRKLHLLQSDLRMLGLSEDDIAALPLCHVAAPALSSAAAYGSLYVLEGSTLGGQIIHRAMQRQTHATGLHYFNPYGKQTADRWRALRARLENEASTESEPAMTAAAITTFNALHRWLIEAQP